MMIKITQCILLSILMFFTACLCIWLFMSFIEWEIINPKRISQAHPRFLETINFAKLRREIDLGRANLKLLESPEVPEDAVVLSVILDRTGKEIECRWETEDRFRQEFLESLKDDAVNQFYRCGLRL